MTAPQSASAIAHPNFALIKYWGKADVALNTPAVASLSITLDGIATRTRVVFDPALSGDEVLLDGVPARPREAGRVSAVLDLLRAAAGNPTRARVESRNDFPTAAGLASSASGFAALVVAADRALATGLSPAELSALARRGSGSAARSLFGGFVRMHRGTAADGADAIAEPLLAAPDWPLRVVIAITSARRKAHLSTDGMRATATSSPYYPAWVAGNDVDVETAMDAIKTRDFVALAAVSEFSCLKMHGLMLSSQPGLVYWNAATVAALHCVRELREEGAEVFFTIDAGPQLKAVCTAQSESRVVEALTAVPGVERVLRCGLGPGARTDPGNGSR